MRPMSTGRRISWWWGLGLVLPVLGGCYLPHAHRNFVDFLNGCLGDRIGPSSKCTTSASGSLSCPAGMAYYSHWQCGMEDPTSLLQVIHYPDGRVGYQYPYTGTCLYTLVVDSKTGIIRGVHWAGDRNDCAISP